MRLSFVVRTYAMVRGELLAVVTLSAALCLASTTQAALPTPAAEADATAKWETLEVLSDPVTDGALAQQNALIPLSGDFSLATGTAVLSEALGGPIVRGFSEVIGASPNSQGGGSMEATSHARVVSVYEVVGTGPVDIDLQIHISGSLEGGNYFTSQLGNVTSQVDFEAILHTDVNVVSLFAGNAFFDVASGGTSTTLTTSGDWTPGNFTSFDPGDLNNQGRMVNLDDPNEDVVILNPGDLFAVELILDTSVFASGPFEATARADFDSTGAIQLTTNAPGGSFIQLVVPEPASFALLSLGCCPLLYRRRSR